MPAIVPDLSLPFRHLSDRSCVPGPHLFTGLSTLGYPDFRDTGTGRMLVADPGESYGIAAIDGGPVPPADGRWAPAEALTEEASGITPPPPVPPVPPVPEGSNAT